MPMATAIPPSDIRLADNPNQAITIKAIPIDIGMDINTRKVARRFIRNSARITTMKINASSRALTTVCTAWVIKSA